MPNVSKAPRGIPPLNWLRAFETVSRHMSFKKAAEELNVTPAAISQQVRQLEDYFEIRLFDRNPRALALTRVGELAVPLLAAGMNNISGACDAMQNARPKDYIVVTAPPSFSMKWLVPRLEDFRQAHPEVEVRIDARDDLVDLKKGSADVGIRYGTGKYSDLQVEKLFQDVYFPVSSAKLFQTNGRALKLADLKHHRLLHVDWPALASAAPNWQMWLKAANISHPDAFQGHRFPSEMMALDAAISGFGIALVSSKIAAIDIEAGRLVRLFSDQAPIQTGFQYYFVRLNDTKPRKEVATFCNWLRANSAAENRFPLNRNISRTLPHE
ncbi:MULTISPECIES: transcriptional regulator GcvA [Rhizobium]|uniref:transcriptional regulator GcvA n=1 Tax=Rhizobium TaxID=379 RepID=UPI001A984E4E|nr:MULTISPECIES: transcriptional regulator GcvA [Rhizobium]MBX4893612.1 transcriptional regulator GcvA [Rhizobium bangladeshense]MBX4935282.1 transcriptional regulator GcvA [Rhizobium bangladeshense]MBX5242662.1 transcriptional regulator GcvA [Rhizobium sp. NLR22b]QSY91967.1 transcriptional regulator GcvA [Rhizobium bangladeshense]